MRGRHRAGFEGGGGASADDFPSTAGLLDPDTPTQPYPAETPVPIGPPRTERRTERRSGVWRSSRAGTMKKKGGYAKGQLLVRGFYWHAEGRERTWECTAETTIGDFNCRT